MAAVGFVLVVAFLVVGLFLYRLFRPSPESMAPPKDHVQLSGQTSTTYAYTPSYPMRGLGRTFTRDSRAHSLLRLGGTGRNDYPIRRDPEFGFEGLNLPPYEPRDAPPGYTT
ncbi:hypothetical protein CONPUDRAFT_85682 [Coniophora puteana RWD-64-598 SS2]|uniref:Uncharacterized protein n=1 Tax=Coniophora puteana (strain RWD-64-598) TaxID=741705 RepID=A0A5M3M6K9_CONPW|nr:uncharacterized protein CONPUDRAFT_85682 [Coniophora puteana RWD-64-598 SS2]EIW75002.1 hypothetical protein CONPUDRAFT_85682 [Coniophora puteana RWD-64-598 SS2]